MSYVFEFLFMYQQARLTIVHKIGVKKRLKTKTYDLLPTSQEKCINKVITVLQDLRYELW